MVYYSRGKDETFELGARLAKDLVGGEVIALNGEMGAGKTVFAKGIASGLGVTSVVTSPTFNIIKQYTGRLPLNHIDLYRLGEAEAQELGIPEMLEGAVTVVEWAEVMPSLLVGATRVNISIKGDNEREITIEDGAA